MTSSRPIARVHSIGKTEAWTENRTTASLRRGRSCCARLQFFDSGFEAPNPSA